MEGLINFKQEPMKEIDRLNGLRKIKYLLNAHTGKLI